MTLPHDVIPFTACDLDIPGQQPWGPGWFLVADNSRVECGPFPTKDAALEAAEWLDSTARGTHPMPWKPKFSKVGLLIGSRVRTRRARGVVELSL